MRLFSEILAYISIYFNIYVMFYGYNVTMKEKRKIDIKYLLIVGIVTLCILIANNYASPITRLMLTIISQVIGYSLIFKDKISLVMFKTFILFVLLHLCDIISTSIYIIFPIDSSSKIMENVNYFRILNTTLVSLIFYLLFLIVYIKNMFKKLFIYVSKNWSYIALLVSCLACICFLILTYFNTYLLDFVTFIIAMLLIIFFSVLCIIMIYQYFKNKHNEEEQANLLKLMTDYEIMLDNEKMNRHEMLNNLVALKSFKDKSSKEFEELMNNIIEIYEDKKSKVYSNLYKLPSGIKGIVYYRMARIKKKEINLNLLISKEVEDKFEKLNQKIYFKICKILGIVIDNAIEAAELTSEKLLLVDIYLEGEDLVIYLENTYINKVDLNMIYNKGVSSKGDNRGYGLYLVKKILNETKEINFNQSINNNKFITFMRIKRD